MTTQPAGHTPPCGCHMANTIVYCPMHKAARKLLEAVKGMLENYIELKKISLIMARSDRPNWGQGLTENDDIHVLAVREAIAEAEGNP